MIKKSLKSLIIAVLVIVSAGCGGYSPNTPKAETIQHINDYSEVDKIKAVKNLPSIIQYIHNPSEKVQLAAVNSRGSGKAIEFIDNPSSRVQLIAVKKNPNNITEINHPTEEACEYAISRNRFLLSSIKNPSIKLKEIAHEEYIKHIKSLVEGGTFTVIPANNGRPGDSLEAEKALKFYRKKDYKKAKKMLLEGAVKGNRISQYWLGKLYFNGRGEAKNYEAAFMWTYYSVDSGYTTAKHDLAGMYYNGQGVKKDYEEAARLYKVLADKGLYQAQYNLGFMYHEGRGVKKDYKEAARLYKLSAKQGYSEAQNNLGVLYREGRGVKKDYKEAARLYKLSAKQGLSVAQDNLDSLCKESPWACK